MSGVALIGPMGTGKSSVGRILAKILELPFIDLDSVIKEREGKAISDIFAEKGESAFRDIESRVLEEVSSSARAVVACGGGVVTSPRSMALLARYDVVWLVSPMSALVRRTSGDKAGRPLLGGDDPKETLRRIVTSREPLYRAAADIALDTSRTSVRQSAQEIAEILRGKRSARLIPLPGRPRQFAPKKGAAGRHRAAERALRVDLPREAPASYSVRIERGLLCHVGAAVRKVTPGRAFVILDSGIQESHGQVVLDSLRRSGVDAASLIVPAGEGSKDWASALRLHEWLLSEGAERRDCIVGVGGGVVGDLSGFVASTYQRGMEAVHVPTTLLSQVDSSIGGKTGVNLGAYKNMVGSFKQPAAVLIDPDVLATLPHEELLCGVAEMIKAALLDGTDLYTLLNERMEDLISLDPVVLPRAIHLSCAFKARVVGADEKEAGLRAILNYGHTMAHAVEAISAATSQRWRHGHAVAAGMVFAARLADRMRVARRSLVQEHIALMGRAGLPIGLPELEAGDILRAMRSDKKRAAGRTRFVLLRDVGDPVLLEVSEDDLSAILTEGEAIT